MDCAYLMLNFCKCDVGLSEPYRIMQGIIICFPAGTTNFYFLHGFEVGCWAHPFSFSVAAGSDCMWEN